ncbi:hypothetical protein BP6252_11383 [Coleophoma cylindrospora]|uniref:Uncharacterized protein n=1 Tax=Coleophoma cylindrospora TaxID=1849047 RepID=A0A3D8QJU9_9HELO|nr:hypothetical protein BP6252_11383 [Coleophoma cylindrospora]
MPQLAAFPTRLVQVPGSLVIWTDRATPAAVFGVGRRGRTAAATNRVGGSGTGARAGGTLLDVQLAVVATRATVGRVAGDVDALQIAELLVGRARTHARTARLPGATLDATAPAVDHVRGDIDAGLRGGTKRAGRRRTLARARDTRPAGVGRAGVSTRATVVAIRAEVHALPTRAERGTRDRTATDALHTRLVAHAGIGAETAIADIGRQVDTALGAERLGGRGARADSIRAAFPGAACITAAAAVQEVGREVGAPPRAGSAAIRTDATATDAVLAAGTDVITPAAVVRVGGTAAARAGLGVDTGILTGAAGLQRRGRGTAAGAAGAGLTSETGIATCATVVRICSHIRTLAFAEGLQCRSRRTAAGAAGAGLTGETDITTRAAVGSIRRHIRTCTRAESLQRRGRRAGTGAVGAEGLQRRGRRTATDATGTGLATDTGIATCATVIRIRGHIETLASAEGLQRRSHRRSVQVPEQILRAAGQVHAPFVHVSMSRHVLPQLPQLFMSAEVSMHLLLQIDDVPEQWHSPLTQVSVSTQAFPQLPQLARSVVTSVQTPAQTSAVLEEQAHSPPIQVSLARQLFPQLPQWLADVSVSTGLRINTGVSAVATVGCVGCQVGASSRRGAYLLIIWTSALPSDASLGGKAGVATCTLSIHTRLAVRTNIVTSSAAVSVASKIGTATRANDIPSSTNTGATDTGLISIAHIATSATVARVLCPVPTGAPGTGFIRCTSIPTITTVAIISGDVGTCTTADCIIRWACTLTINAASPRCAGVPAKSTVASIIGNVDTCAIAESIFHWACTLTIDAASTCSAVVPANSTVARISGDVDTCATAESIIRWACTLTVDAASTCSAAVPTNSTVAAISEDFDTCTIADSIIRWACTLAIDAAST